MTADQQQNGEQRGRQAEHSHVRACCQGVGRGGGETDKQNEIRKTDNHVVWRKHITFAERKRRFPLCFCTRCVVHIIHRAMSVVTHSETKQSGGRNLITRKTVAGLVYFKINISRAYRSPDLIRCGKKISKFYSPLKRY